jgi:hypothetical protein
MVAHRKEEKAVVSVDSPEAVSIAPMSLDPEVERDSAVVLAMHQANFKALSAEREEVVRLHDRSAGMTAELSGQVWLIDRMAEELLAGGGSDEELGRANIRQSSLEKQLERLSKHQHAAELSLQKRLTPDIRAIARLEGAWTLYLLDQETERRLGELVENRRDALWEECRKCAEASKSYQSSVASLGERVLESWAWSRPLDAPASEKSEYSTRVISDRIYAPPPREEIVGYLLEASAKAIKRWEALLSAVSASPGFALPSYEEPVPVPEIPPTYPDTTRVVNAYWTPANMDKPPHEVQTFTKPGPSTEPRPEA